MREPFHELPFGSRVFTIAIAVAYVGAAIWALPSGRPLVVIGLIVIFALEGLIKPVPNALGGITDPISGVIILAALLWTPQEMLLGVGVGSFIGLLIFRRNEVWRAVNNGAGWAFPAAGVAAGAHFAMSAVSPKLLALAAAGALSVILNRIANTGIFAIWRSQRFGRPFLSDWRQSITYIWPNQFLSAPLAVVLAAVATRMGTVEANLAITMAAGLVLPVTRQEYGYYIRSQQMLDEIVESIVRALEGVIPEARAHGDRVSAIAVEVGRRLNMSERELLALRLASRLHDVGLLGGPEGSGREEHHAAVGSRVLGRFPEGLIAEYVRAHHERWDGKGVPDGKRGTAIPLGARILAAAEIYDSAIAGIPPFQAPLSPQASASHIIGLAGTVLEPKVVMSLLSVVTEQQTKTGVTE